jgi:hypothetical protein
LLIQAKKRHDPLFYVMATDESLRSALGRLDPSSVKNILNERRQFFMSSYGATPTDMLSLSQLVEMGQVNEELVRNVAER